LYRNNPDFFELMVIGVNHSTAPFSVRNKLAVTPPEVRASLEAFKEKYLLKGIVVLSTCNRTEWYFHLEKETADAFLHQ
jgi:glutamyl-tRNA reductase